MAACAQNISSHAVELMTSLNLQRERALFCDCVVIQRLNPRQVFPAHRCVLSASSPVLASILSSTGALVELQDPCLSDSVLALLLDYIYTGSMQHTHSQEQYNNLLTAATYLQMDKLQETLKAGQHTERDAAGGTDVSCSAALHAHSSSCYSFRKHTPLFHSCSDNSSQGEDHFAATDVDTCEEKVKASTKRKTEMSREENMEQLGLSKIESDQINSKQADEAQIRHSPFPRLSTSTSQDDVPHSHWTSSSSSSRPCFGAVSVICHSSEAPMSEVRELSTKLHQPSLLKASVSTCSLSGGSDNVSYGAKSQELSPKSNGSIADSEHGDEEASCHIPDQYDPNAHCDFAKYQSNSEPHDRLCRNVIRGVKNKANNIFEDPPSKYQRLDSSDSHHVSAKSVRSHGLRAGVPLPAPDTNTDENSHCEYLCPKGEVKDEHPYSKGFPINVERQNDNCNLYRPQTDTCPNMQRAETSTNDYSFDICQCEPATPESSQGNITSNPSVSERCTSLDFEKTMSQMHVDSNTSDHESNVVWQSYRGHLQYHCMPQEDTHISERNLDHKLPDPDHSDQHSDEEEVSTYQDEEALKQHFALQTTDRVVLLDISAAPAELLVTYKHRSEGGESQIAYEHKSRENADKVQRDEATLAAVAHDRKCPVSGSSDGAKTTFLFEEANVTMRHSVMKHRSCQDPEDRQKAKANEVGSHASTFTVCTQPPDSEFVRGPMTPTSPDFTPFTPSATMKTNKSAALSTPAEHPFKCYLCDRSFSQRGSLNRHVRSHLGVRPFPCPNCPMTFSRQYRVTEHMRVHQRCSLGTDFVKPSASPT